MKTIRRINARIGLLERRAEHLEARLNDPSRREASRNFDRSEYEALKGAILALRFYTFAQRDESSPVSALQELVDAVEDHVTGLKHPRIEEALARSRTVLALIEAAEEEAEAEAEAAEAS